MIGKPDSGLNGDAEADNIFCFYGNFTTRSSRNENHVWSRRSYIDHSAAFNSVSHKFPDKTLADASASRKSRAIFLAIYDTRQR